jgi:hypothetical protein
VGMDVLVALSRNKVNFPLCSGSRGFCLLNRMFLRPPRPLSSTGRSLDGIPFRTQDGSLEGLEMSGTPFDFAAGFKVGLAIFNSGVKPTLLQGFSPATSLLG